MNCLKHFESRSCRWQCPKVQPHDWSCRLAKQSRQQCGCQIYWRNACSKHHCKRPSVGWQYATAPLHQVRWRLYLHTSLTDVCLYTSDINIYIYTYIVHTCILVMLAARQDYTLGSLLEWPWSWRRSSSVGRTFFLCDYKTSSLVAL